MEVTIVSGKGLEQLILTGVPKKTAIICFCDTTEEKENIRLPAGYEETAVFRIILDDLDIEELEEFGFSVDTFFPEAEELARFIYRSYETKQNILCRCMYGESRSAACAAAILEHFYGKGISIFRDYRYVPNKLVFNKVYEALQKVKEES